MKVSKASAYGLHALMYMVRHMTQLPATVETMAQAEGIPTGYLGRILQQLARAGLIRFVSDHKRGYVFAKSPEEISLTEVLETIEGEPLFNDCPLKHCLCDGTPENCRIYARWVSGTRKIRDIFDETTIATAAWNHPEHRFNEPPRDGTAAFEIKSIPGKRRIHKEDPTEPG